MDRLSEGDAALRERKESAGHRIGWWRPVDVHGDDRYVGAEREQRSAVLDVVVAWFGEWRIGAEVSDATWDTKISMTRRINLPDESRQ